MFLKMSELLGNKLNASLLFAGRIIRKIYRNPGEAILLMRMGAWIMVLSSLIKVQSLPRALQFISTPVRGPSADEQQTATRLAQAVDLLLAMPSARAGTARESWRAAYSVAASRSSWYRLTNS